MFSSLRKYPLFSAMYLGQPLPCSDKIYAITGQCIHYEQISRKIPMTGLAPFSTELNDEPPLHYCLGLQHNPPFQGKKGEVVWSNIPGGSIWRILYPLWTF